MEVLPDDLVRECLLRVPYNSHNNLKAVCRSWEAMVSNPKFYADRKISGTSQQLLCMTQWVHELIDNLVFAITVYDPVKGTWDSLPPIDDPHISGIPRWCQCVAVNRKLVLMGGFYPSRKSLRKSVYIYDFESARWSRGADMPTARSGFACCVSPSNGLVYVAGGLNEHGNSLAVAEAYNVEEDKWEILPPMIQPHGRRGCHGVFMEGKFMVISGGEFNLSAEVFDPRAGTWRRWENTLGFSGDPWTSFLVASSCGELYGFSEEMVKKYDGEKSLWNVVASLPQSLWLINCATQWRDWIFVSGLVKPNKDVSYLFHPSSGQSIKVNGGDGDNSENKMIFATTVEI